MWQHRPPPDTCARQPKFTASGAPEVYIVCGASGSGKSTYVQQHKADDDIVFDFDCICAALMGAKEVHGNHDIVLSVAVSMRETFYQCIEMHKGQWKKAWIITSTTDGNMLKLLASRLNAEIVLMPATLEECVDHINNDTDRQNKSFYIRLAQKWFSEWSTTPKKASNYSSRLL